MKNIWIIAQAGSGDAPQTITSEPINSEGETTTVVSQDGTTDGSKQKDTQQKGPGFPIWLIGIMLLLMFVMFRTPQKQKQQQKKLEQSLEKNDRVQTIGGIFGTIVDIKDDEITLKVDESNNTKIKVARRAISRNMSKD